MDNDAKGNLFSSPGKRSLPLSNLLLLLLPGCLSGSSSFPPHLGISTCAQYLVKHSQAVHHQLRFSSGTTRRRTTQLPSPLHSVSTENLLSGPPSTRTIPFPLVVVLSLSSVLAGVAKTRRWVKKSHRRFGNFANLIAQDNLQCLSTRVCASIVGPCLDVTENDKLSDTAIRVGRWMESWSKQNPVQIRHCFVSFGNTYIVVVGGDEKIQDSVFCKRKIKDSIPYLEDLCDSVVILSCCCCGEIYHLHMAALIFGNHTLR